MLNTNTNKLTVKSRRPRFHRGFLAEKKQVTLSQKLKSCYLGATGLLATAALANAQAVYTDLNPDADLYMPSPGLYQYAYDSLGLDLNNDGITDFEIVGRAGYFKVCSDCQTFKRSFTIIPATGNSVANSNDPQAFYYGNVIDSNLDWESGGVLAYEKKVKNPLWSYTSYTGNFSSITEAYLGLRLNLNGEKHYGWARLQVYVSTQCTVLDYAYDATPIIPIKAGCINGAIVYADSDGDGYGDASLTSIAQDCGVPIGYSTDTTDCNDNDPSVHPEACDGTNGVDDNCDGVVDNGSATITFYEDADGDGYGDPTTYVSECLAPIGYVSDSSDCNDSDASIHPGVCDASNGNGVDDNCDGSIDDGSGAIIYYADADGDGYGAGAGTSLCTNPGNDYSTDNTDCNDNDASVNPTTAEVCDGIDNNCDGNIDEGLLLTFYADADGDNYGDVNNTILACTLPNGFVTDNTDCNDNNAAINPAASEICNNIDDNCNGSIDDGLVFTTYYADADGDNYGDANNSIDACASVNGYINDNTDCDDNNPNVNPGELEISNNGIDDNCNGEVDEFGVSVSSITGGASSLSVFPNPTEGAFTLLLNLPEEENTETKIEVLNSLEQIIISEKTKLTNGKLQKEIQLSNAAEGMYLVKVTINDQAFTLQINYQK